MYVRTVSPDEADGAVRAMYDAAEASEGYLPNQVLAATNGLVDLIELKPG